MPVITIVDPPASTPNAKVSRYFFAAHGAVEPAAAAGAGSAPLLSVRCELIKAGETAAVATVDPCPVFTDAGTGATTWMAPFMLLDVMPNCTLLATRTVGTDLSSTSRTIDVADIPPLLAAK